MNSNEVLCIEDLYIDREPIILISHKYVRYLTRQQRDGIRFIYAQWKKKSHGVILNDPVFHISVVQAFLFMNAVKSHDKPNLVLCSKTDIGNINKLFKFWTNEYLCYTYVPQLTFAPNTTNLIEIDSPEKWCKRKWGILIVCDQNTNHYPALSGVDAEFKILITDSNIKAHFEEFADVYAWINPKDCIASEAYKTVNQSLHQRIVFESMVENSILRRDYDHIPKPYTQGFMNNLKNINKEIYFASFDPSYNPDISNNIAGKPAKNKDSTGLKIKSSTKITKKPERGIIPLKRFKNVELFIRNNHPVQIDDNSNSDLENSYDTEFCDTEMVADVEEIFRDMTPEAVARDEGITAENINDVVMASMEFKNNCENHTSDENSKNLPVNEAKIDETITNKVKHDKCKTFDVSLKEMEELACKKYAGSILDSIF